MEFRISWEAGLWSMSLAFVLCTVVAWTYVLTFSGLSYSRSYVQALAVGGVLSAMVMLAIGNDIARGLGLMGALSLIRFRASLKEPRDLLFIFASQGIGVACGVQSYAVAVLGTVIFAITTAFVSWSSFGTRRQFDAVLRLHLPDDPTSHSELDALLRRHCLEHALLNLRDLAGQTQEHSYQLKFSNAATKGQLVSELGRLPGVSGINLLMQDRTVEI